MKDYIEREAVIKGFTDLLQKSGDIYPTDITTMMQRVPTADVKPVVRGEWEERRFSEDVYGAECSVCHTTWDYGTNFCPNCGADMRGERDGGV